MAGAAFADQSIVRDLPPGLQIPEAARTGPQFDVDKATQAYLNLLSPRQRELSDRYFEGGYWLQLWELLWDVGACALLLVTGISRRMRDASQRVSAKRWISTPIYIAQFLLALFLLDLPPSIYSDFLRGHQYGLSQQPFAGWMRDRMVVLGENVVLGVAALTVIYAAVRRTGARWWVWATGLSYYVLNHAWKGPILMALVIGLAMAGLNAAMDLALARWGTCLGLVDRADPAALPLAVALFSVIFFVLTPVQNLVTRSYEGEADAFGLNASREPYGWAMAAMRAPPRPGRRRRAPRDRRGRASSDALTIADRRRWCRTGRLAATAHNRG